MNNKSQNHDLTYRKFYESLTPDQWERCYIIDIENAATQVAASAAAALDLGVPTALELRPAPDTDVLNRTVKGNIIPLSDCDFRDGKLQKIWFAGFFGEFIYEQGEFIQPSNVPVDLRVTREQAFYNRMVGFLEDSLLNSGVECLRPFLRQDLYRRIADSDTEDLLYEILLGTGLAYDTGVVLLRREKQIIALTDHLISEYKIHQEVKMGAEECRRFLSSVDSDNN